MLQYNHKWVCAEAQFGGYYGWENAGDRPCVLRARCEVGNRDKWIVKPYIEYTHGFNDWPFDLFRLGIRTSINILRDKK